MIGCVSMEIFFIILVFEFNVFCWECFERVDISFVVEGGEFYLLDLFMVFNLLYCVFICICVYL